MTKSSTLVRARPRADRPLPSLTPGQSFWPPWAFEGETTAPVNEHGLLGIPAAWFAVNWISNAVATMSPPSAVEADGVTLVNPTPPLIARPLVGMQSFDFWHMVTASVLVSGNFVGIPADFDLEGNPTQVVSVPSSWCTAYVDGAGFTVYQLAGARELLSAEQVLHVRAYTDTGNPSGAWSGRRSPPDPRPCDRRSGVRQSVVSNWCSADRRDQGRSGRGDEGPGGVRPRPLGRSAWRRPTEAGSALSQVRRDAAQLVAGGRGVSGVPSVLRGGNRAALRAEAVRPRSRPRHLVRKSDLRGTSRSAPQAASKQ